MTNEQNNVSQCVNTILGLETSPIEKWLRDVVWCQIENDDALRRTIVGETARQVRREIDMEEICEDISKEVQQEIDVDSIIDAVGENIDTDQIAEDACEKVSDNIEARDIAQHFSASDIADHIDHNELAGHMGNHLDASEVFELIDRDELAEAIACYIRPKAIADKLNRSDLVQELRELVAKDRETSLTAINAAVDVRMQQIADNKWWRRAVRRVLRVFGGAKR